VAVRALFCAPRVQVVSGSAVTQHPHRGGRVSQRLHGFKTNTNAPWHPGTRSPPTSCSYSSSQPGKSSSRRRPTRLSWDFSRRGHYPQRSQSPLWSPPSPPPSPPLCGRRATPPPHGPKTGPCGHPRIRRHPRAPHREAQERLPASRPLPGCRPRGQPRARPRVPVAGLAPRPGHLPQPSLLLMRWGPVPILPPRLPAPGACCLTSTAPTAFPDMQARSRSTS
jgi:hypothetical protein